MWQSSWQKVEDLSERWEDSIGPVVSDQIFISHSREERTDAKRIQFHLSQVGYSVWRGQGRIKRDEFISRSLLQGIGNSGAVVVLVSSASAQSSWVKKEVDFALQIQHETGWRNFVIPLRSLI